MPPKTKTRQEHRFEAKPIDLVVAIAGVDYQPARMNFPAMRQLYRLLRQQQRAQRDADRATRKLEELDGTDLAQLEAAIAAGRVEQTAKIDAKLARLEELYADADDDVISELEQAADDATIAAVEGSAEVLALALIDDDGNHPDAETIGTEFDFRSLVELVQRVTGDGEDPTQSTSTTTTTDGT